MNITVNIESPYTLQQEMLHSFIHGLGVVFSFIYIPQLISIAAESDNSDNFAAACIYGCSFFITFLASTLFHSTTNAQLKFFFKLMDYTSIYFLIAASYTPLILNFRNDSVGMFFLALIWLLCLTGSALKVFLQERFQVCAVGLYVLMGLMFLFDYRTFFAAMPNDVCSFIIAGVFLYATGLIFYVWRKWKFHHAAWHLLSLVGAVSHFIAIMLTVSRIPRNDSVYVNSPYY